MSDVEEDRDIQTRQLENLRDLTDMVRTIKNIMMAWVILTIFGAVIWVLGVINMANNGY